MILLSPVMLCFPPQENVDNPLYVEEVQVVDGPKRTACKPAAANKVRVTHIESFSHHITHNL